jgi:hypothetical protein
MVAPEQVDPLLLYIVATAEVVSMVLITERTVPKQPQALKGAPVAEFGSKDPDPVEGPRDQEASGSQLPEPTVSPEPQIGSWLPEVPSGPEDQEASGSQLSEPTSGPDSQHTTGSQPAEVPSGPRGQKPPVHEPMDIDPPNPLGRVRTIQ